jgi:hypothetical protein
VVERDEKEVVKFQHGLNGFVSGQGSAEPSFFAYFNLVAALNGLHEKLTPIMK